MLRLALLATFATIFSAPAAAQTCASYPYDLANGTTADADQVTANFNAIQDCANFNLAPLASPHFSEGIAVLNDGGSATANIVSYRNTAINHGKLLALSARGTQAAQVAALKRDVAYLKRREAVQTQHPRDLKWRFADREPETVNRTADSARSNVH